MQLNESEGKLLAGLVNDPAYMLLLEKLQAIIDTLTDRLHTATQEQIVEIIPVWKALRTVFIELKNTPQEVVNWLEQLRASQAEYNIELPQHIKTATQLEAFMKTLNNQKDREYEGESPSELFTGTKPNSKSYGNII